MNELDINVILKRMKKADDRTKQLKVEEHIKLIGGAEYGV